MEFVLGSFLCFNIEIAYSAYPRLQYRPSRTELSILWEVPPRDEVLKCWVFFPISVMARGFARRSWGGGRGTYPKVELC